MNLEEFARKILSQPNVDTALAKELIERLRRTLELEVELNELRSSLNISRMKIKELQGIAAGLGNRKGTNDTRGEDKGSDPGGVA